MSNEQEAAPKTTSSLGWLFWVQMIVIFAIIKLFGLLGGLIAWGVWSLVAFLIPESVTIPPAPSTAPINIPRCLPTAPPIDANDAQSQ